jgi:hypothetical protein
MTRGHNTAEVALMLVFIFYISIAVSVKYALAMAFLFAIYAAALGAPTAATRGSAKREGMTGNEEIDDDLNLSQTDPDYDSTPVFSSPPDSALFSSADAIRSSAANKKKSGIEIVISRYNESLNWANLYPFKKHRIVCYNKGSNDNFNLTNENVDIIHLKNVGKCDHTYLYHIVENYDNLPDVIVFLPGSTHMNYKIGKAKRILQELDKRLQSVFICTYYNDVKKDLYNFKLDSHKTSNRENYTENPDIRMEKSKIRPYGKWFESKFGDDLVIHHVSFWGIMAVSREHILQRPKSFYQDLLSEVDSSVSPEVGHYLERSWEAVFYPMDGAKFIMR